ncbi:MAG: CDP-alcohol phosphatidyltransferase family protein [Myxococcota bacterium]
MRLLGAWLVHLYTASSAVFGVWAVVAIFSQELRLALYLMLLALAIDSTDGALARVVDVRRRIPWIDGRRLDDICDFFNYVLVPACFLVAADLLPHPAWVAVPVLASCYGFSQSDAKTPDHFFLGFPSYWNVVALYLYLLEVRPTVGLAIVLVLSFGVFVPLRYIYPSRTRFLRPLSLGVLGAWLLAFSWVGVRPDPDPLVLRWTLFGPAYYLGLSALLNVYRPAEATS